MLVLLEITSFTYFRLKFESETEKNVIVLFVLPDKRGDWDECLL